MQKIKKKFFLKRERERNKAERGGREWGWRRAQNRTG